MHHHGEQKRRDDRKGMLVAFIITTGIMVLEFVGGFFTNSLALLSDSGHMLSDASSLLFSLLAMWAATKPASDTKHFGYHRFEILAALLNGLTLAGISVLIIIEVYDRLLQPQSVRSEIMIVIACIGLVANLISAWALLRKSDVKGNINIRSAYLHILGDALGSAGAIIAGLLMHYYSLYIADPIISAVVAILILKGAIGVIRQSIHILMEGKPHSITTEEVQTSLMGIEGVHDIHDIRIWTITSGMYSFCCHLIVGDQVDQQAVLSRVNSIVKDRFGFSYAAIQIERGTIQELSRG